MQVSPSPLRKLVGSVLLRGREPLGDPGTRHRRLAGVTSARCPVVSTASERLGKLRA
jgi:hypothetical protein